MMNGSNRKARYCSAVVAALALAICNSVIAEADQGPARDTEYACETLTESGETGLVLVQSPSLDKAKKVALQVDALTMNGGESPVTSVVECIDPFKKRFSNARFQNFYTTLPK